MSIDFATTLIKRLGPSRIFLDRSGNEALAQELALQGCSVVDLSTAAPAQGSGLRTGILQWPAGRLAPGLLGRYAALDTLAVLSPGIDRSKVDTALFAAGWERHPAGMFCWEQGGFNRSRLPSLSYYRRASGGTSSDTGMLRRGDAEADAFLARAAIAADRLRPGDRVLVDGEQVGDIIAVIAAQSRAGGFVGVTQSSAIAVRGAIVEAVAADLSAVADNSIDLIVALEPLVPDTWQARLDDYARVLRHDGRILLGWKDAYGTTERSSPDDWDALKEAASDLFLPESRYIQISQPDGRPFVQSAPVDMDHGSEWLMLVASANPLNGEGLAGAFHHPAFPLPAAGGDPPALIDFGNGYDNPYLYRSMVQMGERLDDELKLGRLAECVVEDARPGSADRGAAIAILGYRVLERRITDQVPVIVDLIETYHAESDAAPIPPHVARWRLSLAFLAGRLSELVEDRDAAIAWYRRAADGDWVSFSPLLATKAVGAAFFEGRLHLAAGDAPTATACFQRGVAVTLRAVAAPHADMIGDPDRPIPFYLTELAEVVDMGSQCANAVANLPLWSRDPGLFWRQVDIRRFGLASWTRDVENENKRLRGVG